MRRRLLVAAAIAVITLIGTGASHARDYYDGSWHSFWYPDRPEGPWCAKQNFGADWVRDDCRYTTLEACTSAVIGGNRGFCMANPWYRGPAPPVRKSHKHKKTKNG
jgi:hypothetical protein